jgi:hypothetical protein
MTMEADMVSPFEVFPILALLGFIVCLPLLCDEPPAL